MGPGVRRHHTFDDDIVVPHQVGQRSVAGEVVTGCVDRDRSLLRALGVEVGRCQDRHRIVQAGRLAGHHDGFRRGVEVQQIEVRVLEPLRASQQALSRNVLHHHQVRRTGHRQGCVVPSEVVLRGVRRQRCASAVALSVLADALHRHCLDLLRPDHRVPVRHDGLLRDQVGRRFGVDRQHRLLAIIGLKHRSSGQRDIAAHHQQQERQDGPGSSFHENASG